MFQGTILDAHVPGERSTAVPLVTFAIGPQEYALPVAQVLEIVRLPALLALTGAPAYLCGLLNRRGRHLPVLDGRVLMGEPPQFSLNSQIIIAGVVCDPSLDGGAQVIPILGLLVDEVRDVRMAGRCTPLRSGAGAPFLSGVIDWADRSAVLCDLEVLRTMAPDLAPGQVPV